MGHKIFEFAVINLCDVIHQFCYRMTHDSSVKWRVLQNLESIFSQRRLQSFQMIQNFRLFIVSFQNRILNRSRGDAYSSVIAPEQDRSRDEGSTFVLGTNFRPRKSASEICDWSGRGNGQTDSRFEHRRTCETAPHGHSIRAFIIKFGWLFGLRVFFAFIAHKSMHVLNGWFEASST